MSEDRPKEHISVKVPADVGDGIREHQSRLLAEARIDASATDAVVSLLRLGIDAARREDERVERLERAQTA